MILYFRSCGGSRRRDRSEKTGLLYRQGIMPPPAGAQGGQIIRVHGLTPEARLWRPLGSGRYRADTSDRSDV